MVQTAHWKFSWNHNWWVVSNLWQILVRRSVAWVGRLPSGSGICGGVCHDLFRFEHRTHVQRSSILYHSRSRNNQLNLIQLQRQPRPVSTTSSFTSSTDSHTSGCLADTLFTICASVWLTWNRTKALTCTVGQTTLMCYLIRAFCLRSSTRFWTPRTCVTQRWMK